MSLNQTPTANRLQIGIFGCRNSGKSSLINALTGQDLAIVSDLKGTTTDPVSKAMELSPLGPVVLIDTPGLDDHGEIGKLRVAKAKQVLNRSDLCLLVIDSTIGISHHDQEIMAQIDERNLPFIVVHNKADTQNVIPSPTPGHIFISAKRGDNIHTLKEMIGDLGTAKYKEKPLVRDLLSPQDLVMLVTPIDEAAPKGRLILPQQQVIRDILDFSAYAIVVKDTELEQVLGRLGTLPDLVITDSQVFGNVAKILPKEIPLTSFSILFARYKGDLETLTDGVQFMSQLRDGENVLISEGCTHHRQCNDIGTVKLPIWVKEFSGKELNFSFTSGNEFPKDLTDFAMVIHCGGCTLNEKEMKHRMKIARENNVPMTNYGTAIAHMNGILERSTAVFKRIEA